MDQLEYSVSRNRDFITLHCGMIGKQMLELKELKKLLHSNKNKYSKLDVSRATLSQKIKRNMGRSSLQKYIDIVENNLL